MDEHLFDPELLKRLQAERPTVDIAWLAEEVARTHREGRLRTTPSRALDLWSKNAEAQGGYRMGTRPKEPTRGTFDEWGRWKPNWVKDWRWDVIDALVAKRKRVGAETAAPRDFALRIAAASFPGRSMFSDETLAQWMTLDFWANWPEAATQTDAERAIKYCGESLNEKRGWQGGLYGPVDPTKAEPAVKAPLGHLDRYGKDVECLVEEVVEPEVAGDESLEWL